MSTIDTSTWSPDADLNTAIEGIPLNSNASIAQTWQALRVLMAAVKGDGDAIKSMIDVMQGASVSADGASGLVPKPEAGEQDKVLKGDGTWGDIPATNLGTASRAVQTDSNGDLAVSSITATELGYLSGVTSAVQTQLDAKAADSGVVHTTGNESIAGTKTITGYVIAKNAVQMPSIEFSQVPSGASYGGIIDFHFAGSTADYTSRIIESASGTIKINGVSVTGSTITGTLASSSDERLKTPLVSVPDEVLDAWGDVGWGQFKFLEAVGEKGFSARLHLGLIAQRVKAVFEAKGLDACQYSILCLDADGFWSIRYAEALAMEAACQRRRADRLEKRLADLENRLTATEVANG